MTRVQQVPRNQLHELATLLQREKDSLDAVLATLQEAGPEKVRDLLERSLQAGEAVRRFAETGGQARPELDALAAIEQTIQKSRSILDLEDDWDDQGSVRCSPPAWEKATRFLRKQALAGLEKNGVAIPVPRIGPGPDGSIDLHWKTQSFELLVNVQGDDGERASFYGDDYGKLTIEGSIETKTANDGLLAWLMKEQNNGPSRAFPTAIASS
jgi:hypothetical protein